MNVSAGQLANRHEAMRTLTREQVHEIRMSPKTAADIAPEYGASRQTISNVRQGRSYGPLTQEERWASERRIVGPGSPQAFRLEEYLLVFGPLFPMVGLADEDRQEAKDAAYECEHGRLPHDPTVPCDCWAMEITKDMTNPIGGTTNGISNDNHKARVARFAAQGLQAKQGSEQGHREASPAAPVPA